MHFFQTEPGSGNFGFWGLEFENEHLPPTACCVEHKQLHWGRNPAFRPRRFAASILLQGASIYFSCGDPSHRSQSLLTPHPAQAIPSMYHRSHQFCTCIQACFLNMEAVCILSGEWHQQGRVDHSQLIPPFLTISHDSNRAGYLYKKTTQSGKEHHHRLLLSAFYRLVTAPEETDHMNDT